MRKTNSVDLDFKQVGKTIAYYRGFTGMTQDQLAARLGITKRHLGGVETGTPFSFDLLYDLVKILGIPGDEIFRPTEGSNPDPLRDKRAVATNLLMRCDEPALNITITLLISMLEGIIPGNINPKPDRNL